MINADEARKRSESQSKWTIWDTIQERKINWQIKSASKNKLHYLSVFNIRDNVAAKLVSEGGYTIQTCGCLGMIWDVIEW